MNTLSCLKLLGVVFGDEAIEHITKQWLKYLSEREERVLILRFGLEDGRSRTLEEVGQEFSITREGIRQIEAKALRKMRFYERRNESSRFSRTE